MQEFCVAVDPHEVLTSCAWGWWNFNAADIVWINAEVTDSKYEAFLSLYHVMYWEEIPYLNIKFEAFI